MKQLTGEEMIEKCLWKEDEDGIWQTTCSEAYEIMAGTPKENGFIYCPYCGEKIEQKLYKEKK